MIRKWFPLLLTILLFSNCDSSSEDPVDDNPVQTTDDDVTGQDETPPEISISEIPEIIEVTTELTVNISDESDQVTTIINLDGTEVFRSTQKSFAFELNPFDYPSGVKNIEIVASDANGNENSLEEAFELKRLLLRIPDPRNEVIDEFAQIYYAVNDLDGKLIDYKRVEVPGTISFYADDEFEEQEITMTRYSIGKAPQSFQFVISLSDLDSGTIIPSDDERSELFEGPNFGENRNEIEVSVVSNYLPVVDSHNAFLISSTGFSGEYDLVYNNVPSDEGEVMYSFPIEVTDISEYDYLMIKDLSILNYEQQDFKKPIAFTTLNIPDGWDFFNLIFHGFNGEEAYQNREFKTLIRYNDDVADLVDNSLQVPVLEELDVFNRVLTLNSQTTGKSFSTTQKGLNKNFVIPDLDISRNNRFLNTQGQYNYSEFTLAGTILNVDNTFNQYFWLFRNRPTTDELEIPYYDFEFPPEVEQELSSKSLSLNPDEIGPDKDFFFTIHRDDAPLTFEDLIFFTKRVREVEREDTYSLRIDLNE